MFLKYPLIPSIKMLGIFISTMVLGFVSNANILEQCSQATPESCVTKNEPGRVQSGIHLLII